MSKQHSPLDMSVGEFSSWLLESAKRDRPGPDALDAAALVLGVSAAHSTGAAGAAASASKTVVWAGWWSMGVKPLLIGAAGGLVVAVSANRLSSPSAPSDVGSRVVAVNRERQNEPVAVPRAVSSSGKVRVGAAVTGTGGVAAPPVQARGAEPVRRVPPPAASPTMESVGEASASFGSPSIAPEIAALNSARQALRAGRAGDSLRELERYRRGWPSGVLATEASVLEIEAYLGLGERASALRAARAFLAGGPSAVYAARVRALFAASELQ